MKINEIHGFINIAKDYYIASGDHEFKGSVVQIKEIFCQTLPNSTVEFWHWSQVLILTSSLASSSIPMHAMS